MERNRHDLKQRKFSALGRNITVTQKQLRCRAGALREGFNVSKVSTNHISKHPCLISDSIPAVTQKDHALSMSCPDLRTGIAKGSGKLLLNLSKR